MKLMRMRLPMGWSVNYNKFYDIEPFIKNGELLNEEFYTENLLFLKKMSLIQNDWQIPNEGFAIDLGWYPEFNPKGMYRAVFAQYDYEGRWDEIYTFQSTNRYDIVETIETWLDDSLLK